MRDIRAENALLHAPDLGTWLYRYRMQRFMTQVEMAGEYGVPRSTYAHWECSDSTPNSDRIVALMAYHPEHAIQLGSLWREARAITDGHPKESAFVRTEGGSGHGTV